MMSVYAINAVVAFLNCVGMVLFLSFHWEQESYFYRFCGCLCVVGACAMFVASAVGVYREVQLPQLFFNVGFLGMMSCRIVKSIERERVEEMLRRRRKESI